MPIFLHYVWICSPRTAKNESRADIEYKCSFISEHFHKNARFIFALNLRIKTNTNQKMKKIIKNIGQTILEH